MLIADKSAWKFARHESVRDEWSRAFVDGQIAVTPVVALELLYSARDAREFAELQEELSGLPTVRMTHSIFEAAITALRELSERSAGYHRVKPPDALIAAAAAERGWGVLHHDHHYDKLAEVLSFESRWIVPVGTV